MKRSTITLILALFGSISFLAACSRPLVGTSPAVSPTAAPASTSAVGQPSAEPFASAAAATAPATKSGWWVRLNPAMTTAEVITFQIGTDKLNRMEWRVWRKGEPTEFDVPAEYLQVPRLYLRGNVTPIGRMADLCLMFKERGVEHMDFTDDESETKSKLELDPRCR